MTQAGEGGDEAEEADETAATDEPDAAGVAETAEVAEASEKNVAVLRSSAFYGFFENGVLRTPVRTYYRTLYDVLILPVPLVLEELYWYLETRITSFYRYFVPWYSYCASCKNGGFAFQMASTPCSMHKTLCSRWICGGRRMGRPTDCVQWVPCLQLHVPHSSESQTYCFHC